MKFTTSLILLTAFLSLTSFAGLTPCPENMNLNCTSLYHARYDVIVIGPENTAQLQDRQPEPYDPSLCQASAVLYSYIGKVVVTYDLNSKSVSGFVASAAGQESSITPISHGNNTNIWNYSIPSTGQDVKSMDMTCRLQVANDIIR